LLTTVITVATTIARKRRPTRRLVLVIDRSIGFHRLAA
jgi:hypothetical protein